MVEERVGTLAWLRKRLEEADTDLLREMVKAVKEVFMSAEASAVCGAPYGQPSADRVNHHSGNAQALPSQRVPRTAVGHPCGDDRPGDPEATEGELLPGVAAAAAAA